MKYLESIQSPADLRRLPVDEIPKLADEIRDFLIEIVSHNGGHLAPNLGTVDLTLALHYSFNTPEDKIVWDVGHQAYTHKIITGRRERFHTLRQFGGISGFPRISESEYDTHSVGHASTSISAALGMAIARDMRKEKHSVVAVIGDGSLGGGLAFEGLNNLGSSSTSMTVVLNDNEMSISRNVGALSRYLTRVITDKRYNKLKTEIWDLLGNFPAVGKSIRSIVGSIDETVKHFVIPGKLFEDMGLRYLGPIDGHNLQEMIDVFRFVQTTTTPVLVHVVTKKGKGYSFAEDDATKYHGVGQFSRSTGTPLKSSGQAPSFSDVFASTLIDLSKTRQEIVAITAAMTDGTRLTEFKRMYPERFFDVGIAEEHAVTFSAGLALKGMKPVIALYSTFLQRTYDQIMHDVALDKLHIVFCIDRAGLVGDDGPTHHGMFDLSFVRTIPNTVIMAPSNENDLHNMLFTAIDHINGPSFIRYPRGSALGVPVSTSYEQLHIGKPNIIRQGHKVAILSVGDFFTTAQEVCDMLAGDGIDATFADARFVKPLDPESYKSIFEEHQFIITLENNSTTGGYGSAVMELLSDCNCDNNPRVVRFGLPDSFVTHGDVKTLMSELKLDSQSIYERILKLVEQSHLSRVGKTSA